MATIYTIALYLHRIGALGLFISIGLEWLGLWQMRRAATTEQAYKRYHSTRKIRRFAIPFMLALLFSGSYMTAAVWGLKPWILVALGSLIMLSLISTRLAGRSLAVVQQTMAQTVADDKGQMSITLQNALRQPILWVGMQIRAAVTLGVVFLMVMKPGLVESLLAVLTALALGLVLSIPALVQRRAPKETHQQVN